MSLIVEDGSVVAGADSYYTLAAWKTWATAHGYDYAAETGTDSVIEAAIRRATEYVDRTYRSRFSGLKIEGRSQAREWPRAGAVDAEGWSIEADAIPAELIAGASEAAWRELVTPGSLQPDVAAGGGLIKRVKADVVEVDFDTIGDTRPTFDAIETALSGLLTLSSPFNAVAVRA